MKVNKSMLFTILSLVYCTSTLMAEKQFELAIIKDKDGYTNIRSDPGLEYKVVSVIRKGDFFYFEDSTSDWLKVQTIYSVSGYVHRSRIQPVKTLKLPEKRKIILEVLNRQKNNALQFRNSVNGADSTLNAMQEKVVKEHAIYNDDKYDPVLSFLPGYFCASKDSGIIDLFIETLWADNGSADESAPDALSDCFKCQPELISDKLKHIINKEERDYLIDGIVFGLMQQYDSDDPKDIKDQKFIKYHKMLQKIR